MAVKRIRKRVKVRTPGLEPEGIDHEDWNWEQIVEELGGNAVGVKLYKKRGMGFYFCAQYSTDDLDLDTFRREYGAGNFKASFFDEAKKVIRTKFFGIEEKRGGETNTGQGELVMLLKDLIAKNSEQPKIDPQEFGLRMFEAMAKNVPPPPPQMTMKDLAETLLLVAKLGGGRGDGAEAVKMLREGMMLGRELGEGSGTDGGYADVLKTLGGPLIEALKGGSDRAPVALGNPVAEIAPPLDRSNSYGALMSTSFFDTVVTWLPALIEYARQNTSPELVAVGILSRSPELIGQQLAMNLETKAIRAQFWSELVKADPAVEQWSEWFGKVFDELEVRLFGPGDDSEPEDPTPSDGQGKDDADDRLY